MNHRLYRIVFNKKRGQLMAVAEIVAGQGKTAGETRSAGAGGSARWATLRPVSLCLFVAFGLAAVLPTEAGAQVVAYKAAPASQRPTILSAGNGVPLVNIQTPSAAGVSRNTYSQFDVQEQGLILNNAHTNAATQLGGWVQGNPWLAGGTARVILNEVVSANPSLLGGYVEVAGDRAQVVIANPAGVTCSGCGFINASRATLTTGTPIVSGGNLDAYRVEGGSIRIEGTGLDASQVAYTDLIAHAVEVNAGIWAQTLKITAGANQVRADHAEATPLAGSVTAPAFAIDVAQLGGMYAGKITLVGTEAGVGVRNAGTLAASAGEVVVTADGRLTNSGMINALGALRIDSGTGIDNTGTVYAQGDTELTTRGDIANSGVVAAQGNATLAATGATSRIDGTANALLGAGLGTDGTFTGNARLTVDATEEVTLHGQNTASGDQMLTSKTLDLANSTISAANVTLTATGGDIDARQATIVAVDTLTANTTQRLRHDDATSGATSVRITAHDIGNADGQIIQTGSGSTVITAAGTLDNTDGLLSSKNSLEIRDSGADEKTLAVTNGNGTLIADHSLTLDAAALSGAGQILSGRDLAITLASDTVQTGTIMANRNASFVTTGILTNSGTLKAGNTFNLQAGTLNNEAAGEIVATTLGLQTTDAHTLTNRGLIDGGETFIEGVTLNNLGTGRIYGDHIAIAATTLNNLAEGDDAPTIAARDRLDIGAGTIDNREQALIFSAGDLAIGGALDEAHHAIGQTATLNNASATIEALGSLAINAVTINNTNEHLTTKSVVVAAESRVEYQGVGATTRYTGGSIQLIPHEDFTRLQTPGGLYNNWYRYNYTRTTSETQVDSSEPGSILAGGNMQLTAATVNNTDSRIVAGGELLATLGSLNNNATQGQQVIQDNGTAYYYWRDKEDGDDDQGLTVTGYHPAATVQTIDLPTVVYQANADVTGTGTTVGSFSTGVGTVTGSVLTVSPPATLPSGSLYHTNTTPIGTYLIETDPRFANYRQWLSSDAMLRALSLDPATTQKRLGDGFYEQRLVTEQIAQLTGRRFLDSYVDDEAQYAALMDAGVTVAQEWNLIPGIALSEAQMAALTTDIVWLVDKTVTLADGSTQNVLVPQVYVRVRDGDVKPTGALIAANAVDLALTADLVNAGTVAGRQVVTLTAENIRNLGTVAGQNVLAQARNDLTLQGGTIRAEDLLVATAGHDLTVATTTRTQTNEQGSRTNIDRVAGLYVTGNRASGSGGTLIASAGHDLTLLAAALVNTTATSAEAETRTPGSTLLAAGHDLTLGTVTESASQHLVFDSKNRRDDATATDIGAVIEADGDLTLSAENDFSARAASVTSNDGTLAVQAGRDLAIVAGDANVSLDEAHQHTFKGLLSSKTKTTRDTFDSTQALASTFSGDTTTLSAGNDLLIQGSNVSATGDLALTAGRDLTLSTAQDTQNETHFKSVKKSGFSASFSGGIAYGKSSLEQNADGQRVTQVSSTLSGKNVSTASGRDTTLEAANVLADQDITILAGRDISILAAANQEATQNTSKSHSTSIGLTPSLSGRFTAYNKTSASEDGTATGAYQSTALLAANSGDLTVRAGLDSQYQGTGQGNLTTQGADLLAGDTITLSGNAIDLQAVADQTSSHYLAKSKSFTIGSALAGSIGSKITAIGDAVERAIDTDNNRLQGALALKAGYDAYKLYQGQAPTSTDAIGTTSTDASATSLSGATPKQIADARAISGEAGAASASSGFGVSVTLGSSKSQTESSTHDTQVTGTNLQAKAIDITASETDLTMAAAKLQAETIKLSAERDILLAAAANTSDLHSKNKSSNTGIGVTFAFGGQQNGFSFQVSASRAKGKANGTETTWDNTRITASDSLAIKSGRDTTLMGAQLAANSVDLHVGRDLWIETLQDVSTYASKQSSAGFSLSLCIPPICGGVPVTGSLNLSQQKIKHNYQSAVGQSGIAAGDGGFDINVGNQTELIGAAITSTAEGDKNTLTTASLASRDLTNSQTTKASSSSISLGYGGLSAVATLAGNAASNVLGNLGNNAALPENGSESSTTQSVISPATITLTGTGDKETDELSQKIADELTRRDPETANQSLTNTLTLQQAQVLEEKIQKQKENQEAAKLVGAVLSNVVGDVAASMQKPWADASMRDLLDKKQANGESLNAAELNLLDRLNREGMTSENAAKTLADPDAFAQFNTWAEGSPAKIALHGIVGLIEAKIGDGNAAASVLGAISQEALAPMLSDYLVEQGIAAGGEDYKALMQMGATLVGTAVGTLAAGDVQGASTGADAAFVGVTNNFLKHDEAEKRAAAENRLAACARNDEDCQRAAAAEINKWNALDVARDREMQKACLAPSSPECLGWYAQLYEAQLSYVGTPTSDFSVQKERGEIAQQLAVLKQSVGNPTVYNIGAGVLRSVSGLIIAPAELAALSAKAATGDKQAQSDLKQIADAVDKALNTPLVDVPANIKQGIEARLDLANQLDAQGRTDEATQMRSQLVTDGVITVTSVGTIAVNGVNALKTLSKATAAGTAGTALDFVPIEEYQAIRARSVLNSQSDTLVLGKYTPTTVNGVVDWSTPGLDSYVALATKENASYFSLGTEWDAIKSKYSMSDADMFEAFNVPVLDEAVKSSKTIKFSHDPRLYDGAIRQEWDYLKTTYGYKRLIKEGDFWYAK